MLNRVCVSALCHPLRTAQYMSGGVCLLAPLRQELGRFRRMPSRSPRAVRRSLIDPDATPQPAFVLSERHEAVTTPWHVHRRVQLLHVSDGVLTVQTREALWVVPRHRAVWVLPGVRHRTWSARPYTLCTLYADPSLVALPGGSCVVEVDALLRELLVAAARVGSSYQPGSPEERLIQVTLDRLPTAAVESLRLPQPSDARLRRITEALRADVSDSRSLAAWGRRAGLSERSAQRLFLADVGMSFIQWRQQLRLVVALERLARGERVTDVALDVGYQDTSAFIAMFRSALGSTPGRYFRRRGRALAASPDGR
jgi:AraC-like DNA-binding protein/quercetin dioxygenase-like cupin family protein